MKQIVQTLIIFWVCLAATAQAQIKFLPDIKYEAAFAADISSSPAWPFNVPPVEVNEWPDMISAPPGSSTYTADYEFKSLLNLVMVGVRRDILTVVPAYRYKVSVEIKYRVSTPTSFVAPFSSHTENIVLYLSYAPDSLRHYNDLSLYKFSGAGHFKAAITNVELEDPVSGTLTPVAPADIAANFFIKTEIHAQRYDKKAMHLLADACELSPDSRSLKVSSYFHASPTGTAATGTRAYKPAAFELEWTYVDDYRCNPATGEVSYAFTASSPAPVTYDFRRNSTRLQLESPEFNIPLTYEHGAIVFRFRTVRPKLNNYDILEYGPWTLPADFGSLTVGDAGFSKSAFLVQPHTDDHLNWQYTINFAEQGKFKHVINYFDGSLKDRQTQTKINSDDAHIIAVEKVYDFEGRPSLISLPTPVEQRNLGYRSDIMTNAASGYPYSAADFDFVGCSRPPAIDPLGPSAAAHIYYSPLNPDQHGMQKFVPDAEGYPMVQTIFSPDNTNKVEWQGGAGKEQQLSNGHGTRYEYVRPVQQELDTYLGTEVGYDNFYTKQIVTDPNGQSSYSVLNPQGKVVISGLQGAAPNPDLVPVSKLPNFVEGKQMCTDLLRNGDQEMLPNGLAFDATTYNDGPSENTIRYSVRTYPFFTGCANQYLWATGTYAVHATDDCGSTFPLLCTTGNISNPYIVRAHGVTIPADVAHNGGSIHAETALLSDPSVPQGKMLIDKKITFSEYDIRNQLRGFIKANEPDCFNPEEFFIRQQVESVEFPCQGGEQNEGPANPCDGIRQLMIDDLMPDAKYGQYQKNALGYFADQMPNSIFTLVEDVDPAASDHMEGINPACNVEGCGTHAPCDDGKEGCSCTELHRYPDRCCKECVMKFCSCIIFPAKSVVTGTTPRYEEVVCTPVRSYDPEYAGWKTPSSGGAFFLPAPGVGDRWFPPDYSIGYPGGYKTCYYYVFARPEECVCGYKDTVWGRAWYTEPPEYLISSIKTHGTYLGREITEDASSQYGDHRCTTTFYENVYSYMPAVQLRYRYQSDCITYPDMVINGRMYSSDEIKSLAPPDFIRICNRKMAEAMLPLHPEYCKLQNCQLANSTFEKTFSELETFQEAEAIGLFRLSDIIAKDPFPKFVAAPPTYKETNLLKFPFISADAQVGQSSISPYGVPFTEPVYKWDLGRQALARVYCGAGNYEEMAYCAENMYKTEINVDNPSFSDPVLKQRYFKELQARYIANRSIVMQQYMDYRNSFGKCEPCPATRMELIGKPLFGGFQNYFFGEEYSVERIEEDEDFATLPQWKKDLYMGNTTSGMPPEFYDQYNAAKDEWADIQAAAIMTGLQDCPLPDRESVQNALRDKIRVNTKITPDIIRQAIIDATGGTAALNDLCNAFLVAYDLFPDEKEAKKQAASFACGNPALYTGLQSFLDRSPVKNAIATAPDDCFGCFSTASFSVSRGGILLGNAFENKILDYFGFPWPSSPTNYYLDISVVRKNLVSSCTSSCTKYIEIYVSAPGSMVSGFKLNIIQAQDPGETNDLKAFISAAADPSGVWYQNAACVNEDPKADNFGLLAARTASVEAAQYITFYGTPVTVKSRFYVWSEKIDFMTPAPNTADLSAAINCWDIHQALSAFSSADKSLHAYSDRAGHPLYEKVLTNYLNYTFKKQYSYQQYRNLMEGCAVGDRLHVDKEAATARIEFTSDTYADAFQAQVNSLLGFRPVLFRYKPAAAGSRPVVLVDLQSIAGTNLKSYMKYLAGELLPAIAGVYSRDLHYVPQENMLFTRPGCPFSAAVFPSGTATYTGTAVKVWENDQYRDYTMHSFVSAAATPTPLQRQQLIAAAIAYRNDPAADEECKAAYEFFHTDYIRSADYNDPFRQAYLSYINSLGTIARSTFIAAIDPATLATSLTGYTGKAFTYNSPFCTGLSSHLYAYKANPTALEAPGFDLVKNTIINTAVSGGNKLFPDAEITYLATAPAGFDHQMAQIRKANGNYWYRYFDNTTNRMYNLYIAPPAKKLGRALQDYSLLSVEMGPDPNTFVLEVHAAAVPDYYTGPEYHPALPEVTVRCLGYADFRLAGTASAAGDVMLRQAANMRCLDTLDCEKHLLSEAVLNGKAAYRRYFEENVATYTANYLDHLVRTTKDTLIYCGRKQQYQQTLYYYDRVGNLTRTVPPMGVVPLGDAPLSIPGGYLHSVPEAAKYRDDPGAYFTDYSHGGIIPNTRLTRHGKVSTYKYNSLNQLIWQQTPDGGVTTFFYDAAGRQVFSQNTEQRMIGTYAYNLYDEQGRPEESGLIRLADHLPGTTTDPDNTPYLVTYRDRGLYESCTGCGLTALHPDFVAHSNDDNTYPYADLKGFIRAKSRSQVVQTVYDDMTQDLGAISTEMLSTQENLRNRVAAIRYYENSYPAGMVPAAEPVFSTFYSYDLNGNVKTITYDYPRLLLEYNIRYHRVDYDYDLISGKVNMISYNRGHPDQFYQRYEYDADNRITTVSTSNDGLIWNKDARYEYYKHGPLARMQLGNQQVQSLEYAYTIQGWLKAINGDVLHPGKDMGQNGLSADATYPRDVIAHALRYFSDDYKPIGTEPATSVPDGATGNLYNGNITQQTTGIGGLGTLQRRYSYDQLQRLKLATNTRVDDNTSALATTPAALYKSTYSYDSDGNITALQRWDGHETAPVQIDNFTYNYGTPASTYYYVAPFANNKLLQVSDDPATPTGGNDLQPGQPEDNYSYDRIGQLLRDKQGAEHIRWDRFGKVVSINDTSAAGSRTTTFAYDGRGNRIFKETRKPQPGTGHADRTGEYYVRDAGGNILAVYRTHSVMDRLQIIKFILDAGWTLPDHDDASGTAVTRVLTGYSGTTLATDLSTLVLSSHGTWVDTYTDRPIGFYWAADPALRSTLLYSGSDWIDALRAEAPLVHRDALLHAGTGVQPLFFSAMDHYTEGRSLIRHFSTHMPPGVCQPIWSAGQAQYMPGNHVANADNLYNSMMGPMKPALISQMAEALEQNFQQGLPEAGNFYSDVIADNSLWTSPALRAQNGPWTAGITQVVNTHADGPALLGFFETWAGGPAAFAAAATPAYRLSAVFDADPYAATRDMCLTATLDELAGIVTAIPSISTIGLKGDMVAAGVEEPAITSIEHYASSGDTLALAEHHIYGSSRLGLQRYDSLTIANILHLPEEDAALQRSSLRNRVPWYSYAFADLIDSTQRSPYAPTLGGNTYTGIWQTKRTLGRRYYEMTDHLGNVLATVLDRKTGVIASGSEAIYDHWHADIAQASDYYPGGMMMPGRNLEHDWSRMGAQKQQKDDEIYGKGNLYAYKHRMNDARTIRFFSPDPLHRKYPHNSDYAFAENDLVRANELEGLEKVIIFGGADLKNTGLSQTTIQTAADIQKYSEQNNLNYKVSTYNVSPWNPTQLDAYNDIKASYKENEPIIVYGYSMGGVAANQLTKMLKADGIRVNLLVTVDAAFGPAGEPLQVSDNVKTNYNFYQTTSSPIFSHGYPSKPQQGNNASVIFNDNMDNETSGKGSAAHGTMDEDTQKSAENLIKNEMSGRLDGIIKNVTGNSSDKTKDQ